MDRQQAQNRIEETFEQPFDKPRFTVFVKNLLNTIDESKAFHAHGDVKESFRPVVKTYERIGTYTSPNGEKIDIIIVYLQKTFSIHHARVTQRNFAGKYLTDRGQKDAGLFAFVSPDNDDWRFSLVKMDYRFEETPTGKMKVKEEFTPARRWSFLVGANEKSHTAQSRLVKILAEVDRNPTLAELEEAFNIETVTKEFFLKYRDLFIRTKEALDKEVKRNPRIKADFEDKGVNTVDFAKKLLGQIIFLYFLQKKGWFGVGRDSDWGTGSKQFLRELFEKKHGDFKNFFNDILEHLFYDALRNDRSHDDHYYGRFNCKVPFLNGGLFDPIGNYDWVHTDIHLPDSLFSNDNKTKEGDSGDGILDIFDRYNFTVKEDEPLEKEVAIDPELLGKAYEKFNAIRPDNFEEYKNALKSGKKGDESKFNKQFGVYYTPREIVHYMCRQSLINYLHTECMINSNIVNVSVETGLKPVSTTRSGLKPISREDIEVLIHTGEQVGENEEIALIKEQKILEGKQKSSDYKLKLPESIRKSAKLIDKKLAEITVCDPAVGSGAFPVGMMSEIVKVRNILSLFMEDANNSDRFPALSKGSEGGFERTVRTFYHFKRHCIEHSLYGVDIDPGAVEIAKLRLWLSLIVDEDDIKNIKPLPNLDYRIMQGNSLISELMGINFDDENNLKSDIEDLGTKIKGLNKEYLDRQSELSRHYNKTGKQDQNLVNESHELEDAINKLKKNKTRLNKRLNGPQEEDPLISEFQKKKNAFLNESNVSRKQTLKAEVENLLVKIFESKLKKQKADYFNRLKNIENKYNVLPNQKQRDEIIKQEKAKLYKESDFDLELAEKQLKEFTSGKMIKPFFLWKLYFSEVFHEKGGFDAVIANPPYVRQEAIKPLKPHLAKAFGGFYCGTADIYTYFYKCGIDLLKPGGHLCFIAPNKFMRAGYGENTRILLTTLVTPKLIIDFGDLPIFDATTYPSILLVEKNLLPSPLMGEGQGGGEFIAATFTDPSQLERLDETLAAVGFSMPIDALKAEGWTLERPDVLALMEKLRKAGKPLGEYVQGRFYRGVLTGLNEAFVIDEATRKQLIAEDPKSADLIKPWLRGRDIRKWQAKWAGLYVIFTRRGTDIKKYPAIKRHLEQFRVDLEPKKSDKDRRGRKPGTYKWFDIQDNIAYHTEFEKPKIVYPDIAQSSKFTWDESRAFLGNTAYIIPTEEQWLVGLLNSNLIWWFYLNISSMIQGGFVRFIAQYMEQLPIPPATDIQKAPIIERVRKILADPDGPVVPCIEEEIDKLIYNLYGLTDAEIALVKTKL